MDDPVLIAGGGIGGLSTALGLARKGRKVRVFEGAPGFGAIGYGIQLGPNVFPMFDRLGITAKVMCHALKPDACVMIDALTGEEITRVPTQNSLRERFEYPYIVIHRVDLHEVLIEACRERPEIDLVADAQVVDFKEQNGGVRLATADGRVFEGSALVGADGLRSVIRSKILGDGDPRPNGYVAHRTIVPMRSLPKEIPDNVVALWGGPGFHIVHYPLRNKELFNIVAVFKTATYDEKLSADAHRAEVDEIFRDAHPAMKALLGMMDLQRRWALADRDPIRTWAKGRVVLLGDSAHPTLQSLAQGAGMAIEDGVTLSEFLTSSPNDITTAFKDFARVRYLRTARVQLESRRLWDDYHCGGVTREVTISAYNEMTEKDTFRCLAWLYDGVDPSSKKAAGNPNWGRSP